MLSSISPLGERARASRWWLTATAYVLGSVLGGAVLGLLAGLVGSLLPDSWLGSPVLVLLLAALAVAGLLADRRVLGWRLPTIHRQVAESWVGAYRGWVLGLGFGAQLGFGVVTIVTSSTVYAVPALALLSGSMAVGALVGATFGLVRALPVVAIRGVHSRAALHAVFARLERWGPVVDRVAQGSMGVLAAALVGVAAVA